MTENAVTSVAVPDVEEMAQNWAFLRSSGKLNGWMMLSKDSSGYS